MRNEMVSFNGGIFSNSIIANFLPILTVKQLRNRLIFFRPTPIFKLV